METIDIAMFLRETCLVAIRESCEANVLCSNYKTFGSAWPKTSVFYKFRSVPVATCGRWFTANAKDFQLILTWWPNRESFGPRTFCTSYVAI